MRSNLNTARIRYCMVDLKNYNNLNINDDISGNFPALPRKNTRIAVRYIREDIAASVCEISVFSFGFNFKKIILVELLDISSKGLLIATNKKLRVNQKITILLKFENQRVFKRQGKIVRKAEGPDYRYGIQFDKLSNSLGDYLLATQKKLIFK